MLDIRALTVGFRQTVLGPIDLTARAGEVLALIGTSGAGKSLLAHAIMGLLPANATRGGAVLLNGRPVTPAMRGRAVALVPQSITCLDPTMTAAAHIAHAARRAKAPTDIDRRLGAVGLTDAAHLLPHQLSGGMARRVLLAAADAASPAVLIADEPTHGLDPKARDNTLRHLRLRADQGVAVLLISHDLTAAIPYADRVAILRGGRLDATEPATAFHGTGEHLSPYARALWRALPQNGFTDA